MLVSRNVSERRHVGVLLSNRTYCSPRSHEWAYSSCEEGTGPANCLLIVAVARIRKLDRRHVLCSQVRRNHPYRPQSRGWLVRNLSFFKIFLSYGQEEKVIRGAESKGKSTRNKGRNTKLPSKLKKEACVKVVRNQMAASAAVSANVNKPRR